MKSWYESSELEKVSNYYSKYSISTFWDWWSNKESKVMEIRIQNYELIKITANKFNLQWSSSGVYVNNANDLKQVIGFVRDKATVWFGIQPRKKNWNKWGGKGYNSGPRGGSSDVNIDELAFIMVDIDRRIKKGVATNNDLKQANELANKILERLGKENWNKGYAKIASGHGLQLLIKLDIPVKMPNIVYSNEDKIFLSNDEFDNMKDILVRGIGKQIENFCKKVENINVCIDRSCFSLGRVGALPVTKNFKYDTFKWKGLIELNENENIGLTDYVLSFEENLIEFKKKNVFAFRSSALKSKERLIKGKLIKNELIKYMLDNELPYGMINNYMWFQLKCLIRDSKIDLTSLEFRKIHKQLESKFKGTLSTNLPDKKFQFDKNVVNSFCVKNKLVPVYILWPNRTKKLNLMPETFKWEHADLVGGDMELKKDTDILKDLEYCKGLLKEGDYRNVDVIAMFLNGLIKKYGEKDAKYFYTYLFERWFNWC